MPTPEEMLSFGVFIDIRESLKAMEKFQREMTSYMKDIATSSERMGKTASKSSRKATAAFEDQKSALKDVTTAYGDQEDAVADLQETVKNLRIEMEKASGAEKKNLKEQISSLEKTIRLREKVKEKAQKRKEKKLSDRKDEFKKAGETLLAPLESFLTKDAKGLFRNSFKAGGLILNKTLKGGHLASALAGRKIGRFGRAMSAEGTVKGGAGGLAMQAGGAGLKGIAGVLGGLSKGLSFLTKLGPILGVVSSVVVGLVEKFLDADAMVKDFNKNILQSAGNTELFARSGGSANKTGALLTDTLNQMRDAAFDYETNLKLGITKDDHMAMVNVLTQEGVSLARMRDEADASGESLKDLATQLTVTGVTYSRALGVPIAEIGQLQAEMMTEMGRSLDDTRDSFAMMTRGAAASGIASNKFFAAIRGISQDLSLYNLRLDDSIALFSKLGKVMSPKNAQAFMQSVMSMGKNMGRQQKVQMGFFVGQKKLSEITNKDILRDTKALMDQLSEASGIPADALAKSFEDKGMKGIAGALKKVPDALQGTLTESASRLSLKKSRASKGFYGQTQSISDLGPGAMIDAMKEAVMTFSKGKYGSISEAVGDMGLEATAEALGKSTEEIDQLSISLDAIEAEREGMIQAANGNADEIKKITEMSTQDIINSFSEEMKKSLKLDETDKSLEDVAREQGKNTQSIVDKLGVFVDFFMNKFYSIIKSIWDMLSSMPIFGKNRAQREFEEKVTNSKGGDVHKAFQASGGDKYKFRGELLRGDYGKKVHDVLGATTRKDATSEQKSAAWDLEKKIVTALEKTKGTATFDKYSGKVTSQGDGLSRGLDAAKTAGFSDEEYRKFSETLGKTGSLTDALNDSKVSAEKRNFAVEQMQHYTDPALLTDLSDAISSEQPGAPGAGVPSGPPAPVKKAESKAQVREGQKTQDASLSTQEEGVSLAEQQGETMGYLVQGNTDINKALNKNYRYFKSDFAKEFENVLLSSLRTTLYEYYMYSGIADRSKVAQAFKGAGGVQSGAPALVGHTEAGLSLEDALDRTGAPMSLQGNAAGGVVTGTGGGLAQVRASAGEGLASVGRGERIVPAGGGGAVHVTVNGVGGQDLANIIEGKVTEGIREYKRREKFY